MTIKFMIKKYKEMILDTKKTLKDADNFPISDYDRKFYEGKLDAYKDALLDLRRLYENTLDVVRIINKDADDYYGMAEEDDDNYLEYKCKAEMNNTFARTIIDKILRGNNE